MKTQLKALVIAGNFIFGAMFLQLLFVSRLVFAVEVKGPSMSYEGVQAGALYDKDGRNLDINQSKKTSELKIFIPLHTPSDLGSFLLRYDVTRSELKNDGQNDVFSDSEVQAMSAVGLFFRSNFEDTKPNYFTLVSRYSAQNQNKSLLPMVESIAGIRWNRIPDLLSVSEASHESSFIVLLRYRHFPGRDTWLGLLGYSLETKSGTRMEVHLPSHVLLGQRLRERKWFIYSELRFRSLLTISESESSAMWSDGFTTQINVGIRRKIFGIVFGTFETGMQRQSVDLYNQEGSHLMNYSSEFSPWAKIAIETFVDLARNNDTIN